MSIEERDRRILRDLARCLAEIADEPVMAARRRMWVEHNSLRSTYPMMLIFPEGSWVELLPDSRLGETSTRRRCEEDGLSGREGTEGHMRAREIHGESGKREGNTPVADLSRFCNPLHQFCFRFTAKLIKRSGQINMLYH